MKIQPVIMIVEQLDQQVLIYGAVVKTQPVITMVVKQPEQLRDTRGQIAKIQIAMYALIPEHQRLGIHGPDVKIQHVIITVVRQGQLLLTFIQIVLTIHVIDRIVLMCAHLYLGIAICLIIQTISVVQVYVMRIYMYVVAVSMNRLLKKLIIHGAMHVIQDVICVRI